MSNTITLCPETIASYKEAILNPKKYHLNFVSLKDYFIESETVTAKHILAESYIKHINRDLPKVILYIIMDKVFGQCNGKDEKGYLGYYLKHKTMNSITPFKAKVSGLAISLPDNAKNIAYRTGIGDPGNTYWIQYTINDANLKTIYLPPGSWRILGIADELTEDQWDEVVEIKLKGVPEGYINYDRANFDPREVFDNAKRSGESLIWHLLWPNNKEGRCVILIEQK